MPTLLETYLKIYEHDEKYPDEVKNMTISQFLQILKKKDIDAYHVVESIIDGLNSDSPTVYHSFFKKT